LGPVHGHSALHMGYSVHPDHRWTHLFRDSVVPVPSGYLQYPPFCTAFEKLRCHTREVTQQIVTVCVRAAISPGPTEPHSLVFASASSIS
jgi:hypothetical protein